MAEDAGRLLSGYRAALTSVERADILERLACIADDAADQALSLFLLDSAEASQGEADASRRIAALQIFQWLHFPDDPFRQRVIAWVLRCIETAGPRSDERVYAITASRIWIRDTRIRAKLLELADDASEAEDTRALALDCLSHFRPGEAPADVIEVCRRLNGRTRLGRAAAYVLRKVGAKP